MALKTIFMGSPEFAVPTLDTIHKSENDLIAVYTQPPKKKQRGQKLNPTPVQQHAEKLNIPIIRTPDDLNTKKELDFLKQLKPNIVVVVAYGKIIPRSFLELPNLYFINIHASILPKWRGAAPIQRAILNMDNETGVSIMKIENKLDTGPVMKYSKINITKECSFDSLSVKLSNLAASIIIDTLKTIENKKENFIPQDHKMATYANKVDKSEAKIIWTDKAKNIIAKINAFHSNPGSWFEFEGSRIKIIKAIEIKKAGKPGEVLDNNFTIGCSENAIQILELKKEGKKTLSTSDFLKGNSIKIGKILNGV